MPLCLGGGQALSATDPLMCRSADPAWTSPKKRENLNFNDAGGSSGVEASMHLSSLKTSHGAKVLMVRPALAIIISALVCPCLLGRPVPGHPLLPLLHTLHQQVPHPSTRFLVPQMPFHAV